MMPAASAAPVEPTSTTPWGRRMKLSRRKRPLGTGVDAESTSVGAGSNNAFDSGSLSGDWSPASGSAGSGHVGGAAHGAAH
jgi:hypothetical protein